MELKIDNEFRRICEELRNERNSLEEWAEVESDDLVQSENYEGGFDADEKEFCFSYFNGDRTEYWFQFKLDEIDDIVHGRQNTLQLRKADK